jgi:hypothetical protein
MENLFLATVDNAIEELPIKFGSAPTNCIINFTLDYG